MRAILLAMAFVVLLPAPARSQDPAVTNADKYKVVLENARVRVLEYKDHPGDKTTMHHHPDFVLYALSPFTRKLTFPDGKSMTRDFKVGDVIFMQAQDHIGENVGTTDTHVFIVELKEPAPTPAPTPVPTPAPTPTPEQP